MLNKHTYKVPIGLAVIASLICALFITTNQPIQADTVAEVDIYIDAVASGWQDGSWDMTVDFANDEPVKAGIASIAAANTNAWGGLYLLAPEGQPLERDNYEVIKFWIHGGTSGTQKIGVKLANAAGDLITGPKISLEAGTWTYHEFILAQEWSRVQQITGVLFQELSGNPQPTFYVDTVQMGAPAPKPTATPMPPTPEPTDSLAFHIDTNAERHLISPYIYGANQNMVGIEKWTSRRIGGNRLTGYNWENNSSNAGKDWFHTSDEYLCSIFQIPQTECDSVPAAVLQAFQDEALAQDSYSLITLQMAGYVSKDKDGPVEETETAPSARWDAAEFIKGSPFETTPDLTDNAVYMDELVHFLTQQYGTAQSPTGVDGYSLDNEPALWSETHPRIYSEELTYAELYDRSVELATAIKDVDPKADTFGPALYGFAAYFNLQRAPDADSEGAGYDWFIDYYLDKMRMAEQTQGQRLLDVLDVHWYPEARGGGQRIVFGDTGNEATQHARMQAPRTLWDPTYREDSWIASSFPDYLPILPRLQNSIDTYYPDTKLALTEFSYGGSDHISGGIATADVLGIFGKYDIYMANHWNVGTEMDYAAAAYNLYRNYDGQSGTYGDIHVQATSSDIEDSSVYAAIPSDDGNKLHIIVLNKSFDTSYEGNFEIASSTTYNAGAVWAFNQYSSDVYAASNISNITDNTFTYTIPPLTAYHIVLSSDPTQPTATPAPPTATPVGPTATPTATPVRPTATPTATPGDGCVVDYVIDNQWDNGFVANITITNESTTGIEGWNLTWTFPGDQQITNMWNAIPTQNDMQVSVTNATWNEHIPAGGSVNFGFQGTYNGTNDVPGGFTLNSVTCSSG